MPAFGTLHRINKKQNRLCFRAAFVLLHIPMNTPMILYLLFAFYASYFIYSFKLSLFLVLLLCLIFAFRNIKMLIVLGFLWRRCGLSAYSYVILIILGFGMEQSKIMFTRKLGFQNLNHLETSCQ